MATVKLYDRLYSNVKVFDTVDKANTFMTNNEGWGVLLVNDNGVHVAEVTNLGRLEC